MWPAGAGISAQLVAPSATTMAEMLLHMLGLPRMKARDVAWRPLPAAA
jgi:hypothetical protein